MLSQRGRAQPDGCNPSPVPIALGAILNHKADCGYVDAAGWQLNAKSGDDRLGGLLACAVAERDMGATTKDLMRRLGHASPAAANQA